MKKITGVKQHRHPPTAFLWPEMDGFDISKRLVEHLAAL
jgi:hypothetical protein